MQIELTILTEQRKSMVITELRGIAASTLQPICRETLPKNSGLASGLMLLFETKFAS